MPSERRLTHIPIAGLCVLLSLSGADSSADDHDRARRALERGEVRPIAEILASAAAEVPGDVIEVELEREHGRWVYELKVITLSGRLREILVDAATATIIEVEGR
ncbi:MAG: PepSY domain-containing protein [Thiohalocapsa sp.]|jgi:uncharacterized membrane protein YkoI